MYGIFNLGKMAVTHRHSNFYPLFDIAFIELHSESYAILPVDDAVALRSTFTDMELKTIYHNLTGKIPDAVSNANRLQLLQIVYDAINRLPETDLDPHEADLQAAYVERHLRSGQAGLFYYVKGGRGTPGKCCNLFEQTSNPVEHDNESINAALSNKLPALQPAPSRAPVARAPSPGTKPLAVRKTGPKRGTAKAIIWTVADKMWEEVGKPADKIEVLKLRKAIMTTLEEQEGIRRTSASSELGNWHKERAPY